MQARCNGNDDYIARGIIVCAQWKMFINFYEDMGPKPTAQHSIDRIDNDGNYEPGNCRWATRLQQNNNSRQVRPIFFQGKTQSMAAWTRELEFPRGTIQRRISSGWSVREALTKAIRK